jgi:hypothetical protein
MTAKRLAATVAFAGAALTAAAAVIPAQAHAIPSVVYGTKGDRSVNAYLAELNYQGIRVSVDYANGMAGDVCRARSQGITEYDLLVYLTAQAPHQQVGPLPTLSIPTQQSSDSAVAVVYGAEYHFCPQFEFL